MALTGKAFYKCGVNVSQQGPAIVSQAVLFATAPAGGNIALVYQNGANYAIVAVADRAGVNSTPISNFYSQLGGEFLASSFVHLQDWVSNNIDPSVVSKLADQDVGGYGLG